MVKADLHVHSRFSEHPSEWFLQRLGARESYTLPETIYKNAMERGMHFVTITDHNRIDGALELQARYPHNVFTGVESTTYFPEDGCKVHVLVYGLTEEQFTVIEKVRNNIYDFREYLLEQQLAHSVAHATFAVNKKIGEAHIYKLLLLFDYFEAINGARTKRANNDFYDLLTNLTPDHMEQLQKRYSIQPCSENPWIKGFTGGSDDHSGLQIARSFTSVREATTPEEYLAALRSKESFARGSHNDFKRFTFSIYKIAYEFSREKSSIIPATLLSTLNRMVFEGHSLGIKNKLAITRSKMRGHKGTGTDFQRIFTELLEEIERLKKESVETKLDAVYDKLAQLSDEVMKSFFMSASSGLSSGDVSQLFRSISGFLPMVFLSFPFMSTINLLNESRHLQDALNRGLDIAPRRSGKRVLWFTDTISDLNGPSETIQKCAWLSFYRDLDLIPVVSLLPHEKKNMLPPTILDLPPVLSYTPPFFSMYTFRLPSILNSIRLISEEDPDEIIVSTPGPIGMIGLMCARLLHVPCHGIYHTDFTEQMSHIIGDDTVGNLLEESIRWFYSQFDTIKVPTQAYIDILSRRGYPAHKMTVFPRGIEPDLFTPQVDARENLELHYGIPSTGVTLLYVGRISTEKHVDEVLQIYRKVVALYPQVNCVFAGSGPEPFFTSFTAGTADLPGAYFLGRLGRSELPRIYAAADIMLFPSTTDTFGMAVLEAQACGLPVLVSDVGGPKEIIVNGITGHVLPAHDIDRWVAKVTSIISQIDLYPEQYHEMKLAARAHVLSVYNWDKVLDDIFGAGAGESSSTADTNTVSKQHSGRTLERLLGVGQD